MGQHETTVKFTPASKQVLHRRLGERGRRVRNTWRRRACIKQSRAVTSTSSFLDPMELRIIHAGRKVDLLDWQCENAGNW